jgi:Uma2 family endonuclease
MSELHALDLLPTDSLVVCEKQYVTEEEYWEKYYHYPEVTYEWNNGYLEEKGMSDILTVLIYQWLSQLLNRYLQTQACGQMVSLETGFSIVLPHKVKIRRPDLGVVLNTNPVPLLLNEKSYQGIFDLCIEAISYSSEDDIKRDTIDKKQNYAKAGVKEYYILDDKDYYMAFYHLNEYGVYLPIEPVAGDIIQSLVLPGFQFRRVDLFTRPSLEEMAEDPVYPFVFPTFREEKQARIAAEALAQKKEQARLAAVALAQKKEQARLAAVALAQKEKQARVAAETQMQQMAEKLRALGIDPEKLFKINGEW